MTGLQSLGPDEASSGLHEGVPSWLRAELLDWLEAALSERYFDEHGVRRVRWSTGLLTKTARALKLDLAASRPEARLIQQLADDEDLCLRTIAYLLENVPLAVGPRQRLESLLAEADSIWQVGPDGRTLERRVGPELSTLSGQTGGPGAHLRKAWEASFGHDPWPSEAYREAIKALESALKPVVTPRDQRATLGKIISAIRNGGAKFQTSLDAPGLVGVDVYRDLIDLVWKGQTDRHGTDDVSSVVEISSDSAETAVVVAALAVHMAQRGLFRRVEPRGDE